jgi:plastocyanin
MYVKGFVRWTIILAVALLPAQTEVKADDTPYLVSITVTPEFPTILVGQSETFTATGYDQNGDPFPLNDPQWSGDGTHGTIDIVTGDPMSSASKCTYTATSVGSGWIQVFGGGTQIHGSTDITIQGGSQLARIEVTPGEVTLRRGDAQQFTAKAFDARNNEIPIDPIWATSGGTINSDGLYTSTTTGGFTVTASIEGSSVTGAATVHATHGELARIEVTPGEVTLRVGDAQQFTAKGFDARNNDIPIDPIWTASGGQMDQAGKYTSGSLPGRNLVNVVVGQIKGLAWVHVTGPASCPELEPGQSWEHAFSIAGVYPYYDRHNPDLKGTVVVVAPALPSAPTAPTTTVRVCVSNDGFVPPAVTIGVGDTVRWTNADVVTHAVNGGLYYEK